MKALILEGDVAKETRDFDEVTRALADGRRFWIELAERTPEADHFLQVTLAIHPLAIEDIWNDIGLPKVEDHGEYVQLVMHGVRGGDAEHKDVPLALSELDILISRHYLVTRAHDEKVCAIAPVQAEIARNARLLRRGTAWVAHAVIDRMIDEYLPLIDRFDDETEAIEARILSGEAAGDPATMARILRIKRSLQMLRRTTVHQREVLLRLARAEFDEIPAEAMPFYRDVYDHFARVTELVDSHRDLVTSLLDAHLSMQSNRMNEVMKRLTVISTIMLPLSVIAGVYGMNFRRMPELEWEYGYAFALGLMAAVAITVLAYFRVNKWI
jgi:magnesium transporter